MSPVVPAPIAVRMSNLPLYVGSQIRNVDLIPVLYKNHGGSYANRLASTVQVRSIFTDQDLFKDSDVSFHQVSCVELKIDSFEVKDIFVKNIKIGDYLLSPTLKYVEIINHVGDAAEQIHTITHLLGTEDVQVQVFVQSATADYYSLIITAVDSLIDGQDFKVRVYIKNTSNAIYKVIVTG